MQQIHAKKKNAEKQQQPEGGKTLFMALYIAI